MTSAGERGEAAALRVVVVADGQEHDVFDTLDVARDVARVRSPFLFEIGEELAVRIEQGGAISDARARVRAHVGPAEARITELELVERSTPRPVVGG